MCIILFFSYTIKNVLEVIVLTGFIGLNGCFLYVSQENIEPSKCSFQLMEVPEVGIRGNGTAHYQCEVKKVGFFLVLTALGVAAQCVVLLCSIGSLIWYAFFRRVSQILRSLKTSRIDYDQNGTMLKTLRTDNDQNDTILDDEENKDFWFLMDLIAHSSGIDLYNLLQ